jgi:hypothetical protein
MFADDTSICTNDDDFMKPFNLVLLHISKWLQANHLILNLDKRSIIKFTPTKFSRYSINLVYADQAVSELDTLKFFGLLQDHHLTWKPHIGFYFVHGAQLCYKIIPCIKH